MRFVVIARDGTDEGAPARRLACRQAHLSMIDTYLALGHFLMATALLDDKDQMSGSMLLVDFEDRDALDRWLAEEPYMTGDVWKDVDVIPAKVAGAFVDFLPGNNP
ncbi:MAG: hypothetical protein KDI13_08105 [Alphaproteobacteria bacterium]|nr:hypothetical protein [Alphaproteobacteria bacterium]